MGVLAIAAFAAANNASVVRRTLEDQQHREILKQEI